MNNTRNLYGDIPDKKDVEKKSSESKYSYDEADYSLNIDDNLIYITGDIDEVTGQVFIIKARTILTNRSEDQADEPLSVLIDSAGGDAYSMFSIIDYMESLPVKVNVYARGRAMSAAAMILCCATGTRSASKRCSIMVHEGFSMQSGKASDMRAANKHLQWIENNCNTLLGERTNKDKTWWEENAITDMYLSPEEALDLGIIDEII